MWLILQHDPSFLTWQRTISITGHESVLSQYGEQQIKEETQRQGFICSATMGLFFFFFFLSTSFPFWRVHCGSWQPTAPSMVWFNAGGREARKEGWQRGSFSRSRMRFNVMAQYVTEGMLSWWCCESTRYKMLQHNPHNIHAIRRTIVANSELHATCEMNSYVIAIYNLFFFFLRLLRMSHYIQSTLLRRLQEACCSNLLCGMSKKGGS